MRRRDVLQAATAGLGVLAFTPQAQAAPSGEAAEAAREVDVLVVGGGTAGTIAAIQSGRLGAKTALVEMGPQLGGTTTVGGVAYPGLFHAWGKQVIAGIGWDLVQRAVALDSGKLPDFSVVPPRHSMHQVRVNGPVYAALLEEACLEAQVHLRFYEFPATVRRQGARWLVDLVGKGVSQRLACKQLIDCTGGADVVGLLGLPRLREKETQPGTLIFSFGGYASDKLDRAEVERRYQAALADGRLRPGDFCHRGQPFMGFLRGGGGNAQHVFGADSSTSVTKTAANIAGRQSALRLLRFIRSLPGCENAQLLKMQTETAVRETYRIVGEVQITHADFTSGRSYPDAIAHSFYPIDLHTEDGVEPKPLAPGVVPAIPLRALIPQGSTNLLAAGRCISSDRLANSALRVQASCMAMGQAAGAAAALAARGDTTPGAVPYAELRAVLAQHGAILPAV